jgi:hypothetical protein
MEPFIMFIEHQDLSGEWHKSGPILIDAKTEKDASVAAVNKANSLFPAVASNVLIPSAQIQRWVEPSWNSSISRQRPPASILGKVGGFRKQGPVALQ